MEGLKKNGRIRESTINSKHGALLAAYFENGPHKVSEDPVLAAEYGLVECIRELEHQKACKTVN
jgi:hypothetical protein